MLDDYRRTFPYKLIGPIIDTEQLPTGDQLDQRRSLFPRCLARNNWCSRPPPPLCFPKKWKQKIAVDRKIEGGGVAERDRERDREKKRIEERRKFAPTPSRGREMEREGYEEEGREEKRGRRKKKEITDTETSRGSISIGGGRLTFGGPTTHCSPPPPLSPPTVHFFQLYPFQLPLNLTRAPRRVQIRHRTDSAPSKTRESVNVRSSRGNRVSPRTL